jgi:hypothetical protein
MTHSNKNRSVDDLIRPRVLKCDDDVPKRASNEAGGKPWRMPRERSLQEP